MKIHELINELVDISHKYGNLECSILDPEKIHEGVYTNSPSFHLALDEDNNGKIVEVTFIDKETYESLGGGL